MKTSKGKDITVPLIFIFMLFFAVDYQNIGVLEIFFFSGIFVWCVATSANVYYSAKLKRMGR